MLTHGPGPSRHFRSCALGKTGAVRRTDDVMPSLLLPPPDRDPRPPPRSRRHASGVPLSLILVIMLPVLVAPVAAGAAKPAHHGASHGASHRKAKAGLHRKTHAKSTTTTTYPANGVSRAALPPGKINHILVIEFENEGYQTTFGPDSSAVYLNGTLRKDGVLLQNYYAIGHDSLDNYIAQVSGQSPTEDTQADCADNGFAYANVTPGTAEPDTAFDPGQVDGEGCVYPSSVETLANQLDARYPPNPRTHVADWRGYDQDMGNTPARDGGVADPTGGTDCGHPAMGATDTAEFGTATDQYTTRHNPFVWFHSIIDNVAECDANVVPLGTLGGNGQPSPTGHLARDLQSVETTPRFAFITPNLCSDGHDDPCEGLNSVGTHVGGLVGADDFLRAWVPLIRASPAYRDGSLLVVITFDEADVDQSTPAYAAACCGELPGPNTHAPGNAGLLNDARVSAFK